MPNDVEEGATLLLDDGRIVLNVTKVVGSEIFCQVKQGGVLSNNKGINRKGGLSAPALTNKDIQDIKTAAAFKPTIWLFLFPALERYTTSQDLMQEAGDSAYLGKIERSEVFGFGRYLDASDAVWLRGVI